MRRILGDPVAFVSSFVIVSIFLGLGIGYTVTKTKRQAEAEETPILVHTSEQGERLYYHRGYMIYWVVDKNGHIYLMTK